MATTTAPATVTIRCGRCGGRGIYHGFGTCYQCLGRRLVDITLDEFREIRANRKRAIEGDQIRAAQRAADRAKIDWAGATPCRYSDSNCDRGGCGICIDGMVPDFIRNPHLTRTH